LRLRMSLAAIADDCDCLVLQETQVGVLVVVHGGRHRLDSSGGGDTRGTGVEGRIGRIRPEPAHRLEWPMTAPAGSGEASTPGSSGRLLRTSAIRPVRANSRIPKGRINSMNASIFRSCPEISIMI